MLRLAFQPPRLSEENKSTYNVGTKTLPAPLKSRKRTQAMKLLTEERCIIVSLPSSTSEVAGGNPCIIFDLSYAHLNFALSLYDYPISFIWFNSIAWSRLRRRTAQIYNLKFDCLISHSLEFKILRNDNFNSVDGFSRWQLFNSLLTVGACFAMQIFLFFHKGYMARETPLRQLIFSSGLIIMNKLHSIGREI